ncbi:MAG: penicillin-binding protein 2 [Candidatus Taylorbacteria bacterium]|nr:penicillin-binding protein 2 [Candidatus Taylorbacteria bacterium]
MSRIEISRLRLVSGAVFLFAFVLIFRLYVLQIENHEALALKASDNSAGGRFDRGKIFFSRKDGTEVPAAAVRDGFALAINPSSLKNPERAYRALSQVVDIDKNDFLSKAAKSGDPYEEILGRLDDRAAEGVKELAIPGVLLPPVGVRVYPAGKLGSHVVGFVGSDGQSVSGRYGLERYYDYLLVRDKRPLFENSLAEIFKSAKRLSSAGEADIVTSIEPDVQAALEKELAELSARYLSESSGGMVLDPQTGEIVAMAAYPTFDPNLYGREKDSGVFLNPLVENIFEFGSIMKPLTVAVGLDTAAISESSTFDDKGELMVDGELISNVGEPRGLSTIQDILNYSLNTGAAFMVEQVGYETFGRYLREFGFGEETGIDLPGEVAGLVGNLKSPRKLEYLTASFGQGIAVTPIGMARALSALANGGYLVRPHLARSTVSASGLTAALSYDEDKKRVIKESTASKVTAMLIRVVDEALLGGKAKMARYRIAAKTGTAQIAKTDDRGYYPDRFLHSFFGYFPAEKPRFLILMYTVWPRGVSFASNTLTEPFMRMAKFLIGFYNIPPDR